MTRRTLILASFQKPLDLGDINEWRAADGSPFPYSSWKYDKGVFTAIGDLEVFQDIRTKRSFQDFEFSFTWNLVKGGNSGVKYLIDKSESFRGHIRARGKEFQIIDDDSNPDANRPDHLCGAIYNLAAPNVRAPHTPGQPTQARIRRQGRRVEHWINGVLVLRHTLPEADARRSTPIAFQNHKCAISFSGLHLKTLAENA